MGSVRLDRWSGDANENHSRSFAAATASRRAVFVESETTDGSLAPTPALPSMYDAATQTSEVVAEPASSAPAPAVLFEERLASLELERLKATFAEQQRQWQAERESAPSREQLDAAVASLDAERRTSAGLRAELAGAQQQVQGRGEEVEAALAALQEVRKSLQQRSNDCSSYRAESARAVARLEAMTDAFEKQTVRLRDAEKDAAEARTLLKGAYEKNEMQRHALGAAAQAVAEQQSATLAGRQRLATPETGKPTPRLEDVLETGAPFAVSVTVPRVNVSRPNSASGLRSRPNSASSYSRGEARA